MKQPCKNRGESANSADHCNTSTARRGSNEAAAQIGGWPLTPVPSSVCSGGLECRDASGETSWPQQGSAARAKGPWRHAELCLLGSELRCAVLHLADDCGDRARPGRRRRGRTGANGESVLALRLRMVLGSNCSQPSRRSSSSVRWGSKHDLDLIDG